MIKQRLKKGDVIYDLSGDRATIIKGTKEPNKNGYRVAYDDGRKGLIYPSEISRKEN